MSRGPNGNGDPSLAEALLKEPGLATPGQKAWKTYEEVAAEILDRNAEKFGLRRVEGKQRVSGKRSGAKWEIDARGVKLGDEGFVIVELQKVRDF